MQGTLHAGWPGWARAGGCRGYTPRGQHAPWRLRSTSSAPPHPCDVRPAESPTPGPPHPQVDPFRKDCLLNGLDHIGLTLQKMDTVRDFEAKRSAAAPWLDGATTRVPKIWPVAGMPRYELATPSQDDWAEEGKCLRSAAAA